MNDNAKSAPLPNGAKADSPSEEISLFQLILISSAFVLTIRNIPILAETGMHQIVLLFIAMITFLLPTALVSAELATGWPLRGGVYAWVREAFGEKWGFVAIWLQWFQMPFGMVAILSFVASGLAFVFNESLATNGIFIASVTIATYWALTLFNFRGMKASGMISGVGVVIGVYIPAILLIGLGAYYFFSGSPIQISFAPGNGNYMPDLGSIKQVALMGAIIFIFAGMETSASHANEVVNPQRNFPIAIAVSSVILMVVNLAGGLSVAMVIPADKISLTAGIYQAFEQFLTYFNLKFIVPIVALMIAAGGIGQVSTWIVGPVKGLLATAENGDLPPVFSEVNKNDIPVKLLIAQASFVTLISLVFLVADANTAMIIVLNALIMIYCVMYILMFMAGLKLRFTQPDTARAYRIPGSANLGMWIAAGLGIFSSIFVIFIGFEPPAGLSMPVSTYRIVIGLVFLFSTALPFVIYALRRPEWKKACNS